MIRYVIIAPQEGGCFFWNGKAMQLVLESDVGNRTFFRATPAVSVNAMELQGILPLAVESMLHYVLKPSMVYVMPVFIENEEYYDPETFN